MSDINAVIIGCGGHGRVILDILQCMGNTQVLGFLDDNQALQGKIVNGIRVLGTSADLSKMRERGVSGLVVGIGDNHIRAKVFESGVQLGFEMINAIHPRATLARDVQMGPGLVVMAGAVINTGTVIGKNTCINTGATIDHDNRLADHVHVYPGANLTGGVTVGEYSYIATNAAVNPYLTIGKNVTVGTGAAVISNVPDNVTVTGVPARIIKERKRTIEDG